MESVRFRAMNTEVLLAGEGNPVLLSRGFEKARQFIQASEKRFSRFLEESELSALNRAAGSWFEASAELFSVVNTARQFFRQTGGLFDPSVLPDLRRAGYDRSMDLLREQVAAPQAGPRPAGRRPSFDEMKLDVPGKKIRLPPLMALDLGGIAKGWIAERAANLLSGYATACAVDAGGDMSLVGLPNGLDQWPVELEDPLDPNGTLAMLHVGPGAVATSTVTKRIWKQGEKTRHHLIDPRTGEPAAADWLSVTVISSHADAAEAFAKALLIAGPQGAEAVVRKGAAGFSYLAVDRERGIWGTEESFEYVHVH